jgi:hypothetical protein
MLVAVVRLRGRKRKGSVFRFAPESGPTSRSRNYFRRQLLANAAIAASRVGVRPRDTRK